jgi:hypothetical protein
MPTGLYRQTCRGRTRNRPIEGINCKKIESTGKPDFSLVYATRMEFLRTTGGNTHGLLRVQESGRNFRSEP